MARQIFLKLSFCLKQHIFVYCRIFGRDKHSSLFWNNDSSLNLGAILIASFNGKIQETNSLKIPIMACATVLQQWINSLAYFVILEKLYCWHHCILVVSELFHLWRNNKIQKIGWEEKDFLNSCHALCNIFCLLSNAW